jgi:hypothetical protein
MAYEYFVSTLADVPVGTVALRALALFPAGDEVHQKSASWISHAQPLSKFMVLVEES